MLLGGGVNGKLAKVWTLVHTIILFFFWGFGFFGFFFFFVAVIYQIFQGSVGNLTAAVMAGP